VGCYAGATIMEGLTRFRVPLLVRRAITLVPALIVLSTDISPTWALVLSQVFLSLGIPFALVPLVRLTSRRDIMGEHANGLPMRVAAWTAVAIVVALNVVLVVLAVGGFR
jgi:manganese transport protein